MDYITIDLTLETLNNYSKVIGGQGENKIKGLKIIIPNKYEDWSCYLDFENSIGEKYRCITNKDLDGNAFYEFTAFDTTYKGSLFMDLVLIKDEMVAKPFSEIFIVKEKICAEKTPEDFTPIVLSSDAILSNNEIDNLLEKEN